MMYGFTALQKQNYDLCWIAAEQEQKIRELEAHVKRLEKDLKRKNKKDGL